MDYQNLYNTNADFKRCVEKYCAKHRLTADEALKHLLVQNVGDMYAEDGKRILYESRDKT